MPDKSSLARSDTAIFALLGLASAMCVALVVARRVYGHTGHFQFLLWNLFLAWVPTAPSPTSSRQCTAPKRDTGPAPRVSPNSSVIGINAP